MESIGVNIEDIKHQLEHFDDDKRPVIWAVDATLAVLTTLAVISRLWSRKVTKMKLRADDYTLLAALAFSYGLMITGILGTVYGGLGLHTLRAGMSGLKFSLRIFYSYQLLYALSICFIKTSIVLLFRRLFPTARFKLAANIMLAFNLVCFVAFIFTVIFQCDPVPYAWENPLSSKCINRVAFFLFAGVMGCVTDIAILIMPMVIVWKLQCSRKRKVALTVMFLLGGFVCVASIARLPYVVRIEFASDPTWRATDAGIWSNTEVCMGIICACLPTLRPLLRTTITEPICKLKEERRRKRQCPTLTGGATSPAPSYPTKICSCQAASATRETVDTDTTKTGASSFTTLEKPEQCQCQCQQSTDTTKDIISPPPIRRQESSTNCKSRYILDCVRNHSPLRWPLPLATAPVPPSMV